MTGTVTRVMTDKGFGFITGTDGTDYFFHQSAAPFDWASLMKGTVVTFQPTHGPKGPRAEHVMARE